MILKSEKMLEKKINTKTQLKIKDFKNTPQTKLSLQLFPNLQYVAFVSLL